MDAAVVGDWVLWEPGSEGQGRVEEILPRTSILLRPGRSQGIRPVAANLDRMLIVFAAKPQCDFLLLDQFLAVCEIHSIDPVLILNKIDLPQDEGQLESQLTIYQGVGYPVIRISAYTGEGVGQLKQLLKDHTSILVGQSGVGKSSLTNALLPDKNLRVAELSGNSDHGNHTTTTSTLYHLPAGGDLIDSPGVNIFGLAGITEQTLATGFKEFQHLIEQCRFNDCRHLNDKGCAIQDALEEGGVSDSRYQRFLKLREKLMV